MKNIDIENLPTTSPNLLQRIGKGVKNGFENIIDRRNDYNSEEPLESFKAINPEIRNYIIDPNRANMVIEENPNTYAMESFAPIRERTPELEYTNDTHENLSNLTLDGMVIKQGKKPGIIDNLRTKVKELNEVGFNKDDNMNLREEIKDRYDKFVNNKTDYSAKMTNKEKVVDWILKNRTTIRGHFPVASDMYTDALTDFSRARKNSNAEVLENMNSLDKNVQEALRNYGVNEKSRGVHYDEKSLAAQKFAKSRQLKQFFAENEDAIKNGEIKEYSFNFGIKDSPAIRENADRYASLQHAKIINPYIDENGNMHGTLIDNYDFERRPVKNILNGKNIINNHGYNMQEKGNLENYFTTLDINSKPDWHYYWLRNKYKKRR